VQAEFAALGDWFPGATRGAPDKFGSGVMTWNNNNGFNFLYHEFEMPDYGYNPKLAHKNNGDQHYIIDTLRKHGHGYEVLQELIGGIYSYKRNNCGRHLPPDSRIVCFHGFPRPHDALGCPWVRNYWRA
jgi:hypothetical protein